MDYTNQGAASPPGTNIQMGGQLEGMEIPQQAPEMPVPEAPPAPPNPGSALNKLLEQTNIAEHLDEKELEKIGSDVHQGYQVDLKSKMAWDQQVDEWVKLAAQIKTEKSFPWPKASNVQYPLLATAAMQFAARAYPSLIPADGKIVQFKVIGADPNGGKAVKADKLAKHMNYQLLEDMADWEEEMDKLMIQLPVVGCLFKKTYFDPILKRNESRLVGPKDLIVNYWASSLEMAHRKTEIVPLTKNQLKSMQAAKLFLEVENLEEPSTTADFPKKADVHGNVPPSTNDDTTPYLFLEQHTFLDLDKDGYQEPYIITIEEKSRKVFRIVARFDSDGIKQNEDGDIIAITPVEYYTKYSFIPNPDGGFYEIGFGHLLGPINASANTVINQLIDAGTLANLQAGFLGKGLKLKMGEAAFSPGEWKHVNSSGQDLKQQIFPLPTKEPSETLFKLLGMLLESGRELASVAEIFTGKMPGQNTPATTTNQAVEQGMKVFTAIYKRTYRSLAKEFKKLFRLNSLYDENFEKAQLILDEPIVKEDYDVNNYDVCPTADPSAVSTTQKLMKVQQLMELIPLGTLNIMEITKRVLEAQEQPNLQAIMQQPQPQVDPKVQAMEMKGKMEQEKHQMDMAQKQVDAQMKAREMEMDMKFKEREMQMDMQMKQMELRMKGVEAQMDMEHQTVQHNMDLAQADQQHRQTTEQQDQKHKQALTQTKEKASATANARKVSGMERKSSNSGSNGGNKGKN